MSAEGLSAIVSLIYKNLFMRRIILYSVFLFVLSIAVTPSAFASSYGSLSNFDAVNGSGTKMYGFEIELDDIHSTDITYTYDWNHFGTPTISEDNSVAGHPKTFVRYMSKKAPDGSWLSFTNPEDPSSPMLPTDGHQCTNPAVNLGCEHFGVGNSAVPSAVLYHWLADDGSGNLVNGPAVDVAMPTYVYQAAIPNAQPARVQAVIAPPPPPVPQPKEFGKAVWVKEIKTTTHNNNEIELRKLVSDDPDSATDENWTNGEPDEVEVEWRILQKRNSGAGGNDELVGAAEDLQNGDEVVTRRYEFYKYTGHYDPESNEALCDTTVSVDDVHGIGIVTGTDLNGNDVDFDCGNTIIVGDYQGAQMVAFDAVVGLDLIDNVQEGEKDVAYTDRTLVVGGEAPYDVTVTNGSLPDGMTVDAITGVLSGTPLVGGTYTFTVSVTDFADTTVSSSYNLVIIGDPIQLSDTVTTISASSLNPAVYGDSVSFAASVSGPGVPTGTVQFVLDGLDWGIPVELVSGVATSSIVSDLSVGSHTVSAVYSGDTENNPSTSDDYVQVVGLKDLTVTADNQSMTVGDPEPEYTFQYSSDFVNGETLADIDTVPVCAVVPPHVLPGEYPISCSGGVDNHYSFVYADGVLTVHDIPAPVITGEQLSQPNQNSITVTWLTDHDATSRVVYGTSSLSDADALLIGTPNYGYSDSTIEDSLLVTSHSVDVTGLVPGTRYYLRSVSHGSPESIGNELVIDMPSAMGSILVKKVTIGGDATFHFNASYTGNGFDLMNGQENNSGLIDASTVYSVNEDTVNGWQQNSASCDNGNNPSAITVIPGQTVVCTFVNSTVPTQVVNGSISGILFNDRNNNGVMDAKEKPLEDWIIYIDSNDNGKRDSGEQREVTRQNGKYKFNKLAPGTYIVREIVKSKWAQTMPVNGKYTVQLASGDSVKGIDFGNYSSNKKGDDKGDDKDHGSDKKDDSDKKNDSNNEHDSEKNHEDNQSSDDTQDKNNR